MIKSRFFQSVLLAIAAGLYFYLPVWSVSHGLTNNDFKHIYLGMKALLDGNTPYTIQSLHHQAALQGYREISLNPFVYLPFTGYSMAFLAPFSLNQASYVWFFANHLFTLGTVYLLSNWFPFWRVGSAALITAALALNIPLYRTLSAGQLNLVLLFLTCLSFDMLQRKRVGVSAILLAFAALFKLTPGLYGLYFLLTRQWKSALTMLVMGSVLLVVSTLIAGPSISSEFLIVLQQMGYGKSTWPWAFSFWDDPANQSFNSFFTHIMTKNDHTKPWLQLGQTAANVATLIITAGLSGAWIAALLRCPRNGTRVQKEYVEAGFCATLLLALLIPSLLWDHYLVMLIFPVTWMIKQALAKKRKFIGISVIACYIITAMPWNFESASWQSRFGIFLMSMKLWPTLLLFGLSLCFVGWSSEKVAVSEA